MYKYYLQLCYFSYICFIAIIIIDMSTVNGSSQHLQKRYLSFRNMSHFFLRFNFKANVIPWTQIFAQAVGFRMNWDEPPDTFHPLGNHYIHRRTVYNNLETLLDKNGLNGFQCVRRAICEMKTVDEPRKIYHKLLKMVFRQQSSTTAKWHNTTSEDCEVSLSACPFSLLHVSLYTDTI